MRETPVVISDFHSSIFGILRDSACEKLVILLPAASGTRIGPQQIYVQIARELLNINVASFSVDLPPNGDSFEIEPRLFPGTYREKLIAYYKYYLDKIIEYFNLNYKYNEYMLLSISVGCIPIIKYSRENNFSNVILLSPNNLINDSSFIDRKNLRAYKEKLFQANTWKKLIGLNLNIRNIVNNLIRRSSFDQKEVDKRTLDECDDQVKSPLDILIIFGEKDEALEKNQIFWKEQKKGGYCTTLTEYIISGADHSFFGWHFKKEVCNIIVEWLKNSSRY